MEPALQATELGASREAALRKEASSWAAPTDASAVPWATEAEIPVLDLGPYFASGSVGDLEAAAERLLDAALSTGFHYVTNHGVPPELVAEAFEAARRFHALPGEAKACLAMDAAPREGEMRAGCGYLGEANWKLPARDKPNRVASFVVKREVGPRGVTLDRMPWPDEGGGGLAGFRATVERYCAAMEALALRMLPIYAVALGLKPSWFAGAFADPLYRLRLSAYGATPPGEYGINPHVDTSFFTILATSGPGLIVQSSARAAAGEAGWVRAPHRPGALVINFGELLSQVTNDSWPATRHYAVNAADGGEGDAPRLSLPFFFNATPTHRMAVLPTCCGADNPARYPPLSYLEGQGVAQGE